MRIGLFHASLPQPGRKLAGVEVVVHRLASELARRPDHDVFVLSVGPAPDDAPYESRQLALPKYFPVGHAGRLLALPTWLNGVALPGCEVLHLHGDDWFYVKRPLPTVRTLHGSALREAQTARTARRRALQYGLYPLERLSSRLADVTLAVGPDASRLYARSVLIDNGIDASRFSPGPKATVPTVLFVGGWSNRKRGYLVHRAFVESVLPRFPLAELVMVSDHADPAPGVRHLSHVSDDQLATLYRQAWVLAYPSEYEGFGLPYLEAMASGTPVLATPNDGAEHVLGNGRWGRIVHDEHFSTELVRLLEDQTARAQLAAAGLERASQLSWARIADRHIEQYEQAVLRFRDRRVWPASSR